MNIKYLQIILKYMIIFLGLNASVFSKNNNSLSFAIPESQGINLSFQCMAPLHRLNTLSKNLKNESFA